MNNSSKDYGATLIAGYIASQKPVALANGAPLSALPEHCSRCGHGHDGTAPCPPIR